MAASQRHAAKEMSIVTSTELGTLQRSQSSAPIASKSVAFEKHRPTISVDTSVDSLLSQPSANEDHHLPSRDKGRAAITALIACIFLDATTYGVLLSYGVFQEYYTNHFVNHSTASWIGVLSNGIVFLGAPAVTYCCQHFTLARKYYIWAGFVLCLVSLIVSAFVKVLPGLIVSQGLCYGLGSLLIGIPELIILNTWFDRRRGLAYGIVFGASDLLGAAYTLLATELLHRFGFRITLLVFAAIIFVCAGPAIIVLQERVEPNADGPKSALDAANRRRSSSSTINAITRSSTFNAIARSATMRSIAPASATKVAAADLPFTASPLKRPTWSNSKPKKRYYQRSIFYIFSIANLLQACAAYLPFIYLPVFATQLGLSKQTGALILAVGNIGMLFGDLAFGQLSDKVHVNILIFVSSGVSAVATFAMWGLADSGSSSMGILIAFAFIFGCFAGGFIVLWARMGTLFGERDAAMVYGTMCAGRGVGGILSGPVSQALLQVGTPAALHGFRAGQYGSLVVFVGICMASSAIMGVLAIGALSWKKEENFHPEDRHRGQESAAVAVSPPVDNT